MQIADEKKFVYTTRMTLYATMFLFTILGPTNNDWQVMDSSQPIAYHVNALTQAAVRTAVAMTFDHIIRLLLQFRQDDLSQKQLMGLLLLDVASFFGSWFIPSAVLWSLSSYLFQQIIGFVFLMTIIVLGVLIRTGIIQLPGFRRRAVSLTSERAETVSSNSSSVSVEAMETRSSVVFGTYPTVIVEKKRITKRMTRSGATFGVYPSSSESDADVADPQINESDADVADPQISEA